MGRVSQFCLGAVMIGIGAVFFRYVTDITASQCPISDHMSACIIFGTIMAGFCLWLMCIGVGLVVSIVNETAAKVAMALTFWLVGAAWIAFAVKFYH